MPSQATNYCASIKYSDRCECNIKLYILPLSYSAHPSLAMHAEKSKFLVLAPRMQPKFCNLCAKNSNMTF